MDTSHVDQTGQKAADKGKDYELLVAAQEAFRLLQGRVTTLTYQPLGLPGIDVAVQDATTLSYIQCKRQGGTSPGEWTLARLRAKRVLSDAYKLLSTRADCLYCFTSNRTASDYEAAITWAQEMSDLPDIQLAQYLSASENHVAKFREYTGIDATVDSREIIRHFMSRLRFNQTFDLDRLRETLEFQASTLLVGPKHHTLKKLLESLDENQGVPLTFYTLSGLLAKHDIHILTPVGDPAVAHKLVQLTDAYLKDAADAQFSPPLKRAVSADLLACCSKSVPQVICVHGDGGSGKSQVLAQLVRDLHEAGIPLVTLQLDRLKLEGGLRSVGAALSLAATPTVALRAAAGQQHAYLVIDQLDTLRWASTQRKAAWRTIGELFTETRQIGNMSVVMACRTTDMSQDLELRGLIEKLGGQSGETYSEFDVPELLEGELATVTGHHPAFAALGPKSKACLRNCQLLKLWIGLIQSGSQISFETTDELLTQHWRWVVGNKPVSLGESDLAGVVNTIAKITLDSGATYVSSKEFTSSSEALEFLTSNHVLKRRGVRDEQVCFTHQLMLDFWQGQVLPDNAEQLWKWLAQNDQDLSVRPALRRTLERLARHQHANSRAVFQLLLGLSPDIATDVRWHIKQIALEQLATIDSPKTETASLMRAFITAIGSPIPVIERLLPQGHSWCREMESELCEWLVSDSPPIRNAANKLVRSLMPAQNALVDSIISRLWSKCGSAAVNLVDILPADCSSDSSLLFATRLKWLDQTSSTPLNDASHWVAYGMQLKRPLRAALLLRAAFSKFLDESVPGSNDIPAEQSGLSRNDGDIWAECGKKLESDSVGSFELLFPILETASVRWRSQTGSQRRTYRRRQLGYPEPISPSLVKFKQVSIELVYALERVLRLPLKGLGSADSKSAERAAATLCSFRGTELGQVGIRLLRNLAEGAPNQVASAITPLLARGWVWNTGYSELRKGHLQQLVQVVAEKATANSVLSLTKAILTHYPRRERELFRRYHELAMEFEFTERGWGESQYQLLEAVFDGTARRGIEMGVAATERLNNWRRKFSKSYSKREGIGGTVTSPIPRKRLKVLSDTAWIAIMSKAFEETRRWRQLDAEHVGEATHSHFATDLATIAKENPRRVVNILRKMSASPPPSVYISNALWAIATCDKNASEIPLASEVEDVFRMCSPLKNWNEARGIAVCVGRHSGWDWSNWTIDLLEEIALRGPQEEPVLADGRDIGNEAINNPRPIAVDALVKLSKSREHLHSRIDKFAAEMLAEPDGQRAWEGLRGVAEMWQRRRGHAISLYLNWANAATTSSLAWRPSTSILKGVLMVQPAAAMPIMLRMFESTDDSVAEIGATWLAAAGIAYGENIDLAKLINSDRVVVRVGVAKAAKSLIGDERYRKNAWAQIIFLLNDREKKVRDEVRLVLMERNGKQPLSWPEAPSMALFLVASTAFLEDRTYLLDQLDEFNGSLAPFAEAIFMASKSINLATQNRKVPSWTIADNATKLASVLIRLYQELAPDPSLKTLKIQCLDAWDLLLENGVLGTHEQLRLADN